MSNKQITTPRKLAYVLPIMSSAENSQENAQISPELRPNRLAKDMTLEKTLQRTKETLKANCNRLLNHYNENLKECLDEDLKTGLLIDTAIKLAAKNLAEEKALFKRVEDAAKECNNASFKYFSECKTFLETSKKNKRRFDHLIENLTTEQGEASSCKIRKM